MHPLVECVVRTSLHKAELFDVVAALAPKRMDSRIMKGKQHKSLPCFPLVPLGKLDQPAIVFSMIPGNCAQYTLNLALWKYRLASS
jgi:hypothetical protein